MAPKKKIRTKKSAPRKKAGKTKTFIEIPKELFLDLVTWLAYLSPRFFEDLVAKSSDRDTLKKYVIEYLVKMAISCDFTDVDLLKLQRALQGKIVKVDFVELMRGLHKYTTPKATSATKIFKLLKIIFRPWAPWDPIIGVGADPGYMTEDPPKQ